MRFNPIKYLGLWLSSVILSIIKSILRILTLTLVFFCGAYILLTIDLPDIHFLKKTQPEYSRYMLQDSFLNNNLNHDLKPINYIPISQISPYIVKAVLTAEDDSFFEHDGFAWQQMHNALLYNLSKKRFAHGASTITQQLARNLFLGKSKTLFRKIRESILTYQLEKNLSKKRILELYLNFAEFGPGIYGVDAACRYHFQTEAKQVSPSQAALLAAVLPNPKFYGKKPYSRKTVARQNNILFRMNHYGAVLPQNFFTAEISPQPILKPQTSQINKSVTVSLPANTSQINKQTSNQTSNQINQNVTEIDTETNTAPRDAEIKEIDEQESPDVFVDE